MERAIIYARVSTDDQRGNFSIPTQVQECIRYAEQKDYAIVGDRLIATDTGLDIVAGEGTRAYVDDFTSREMSRPGLDSSLRFLDATGFDVVIVHAIDRLARDPYIRRTLELEFERRGARIEYVLGNYEATPDGEVRKDLDATFAKWENAKRVERSLRGKKGKAKQGLFVAGRAPYGYTIDQESRGGLRVDDRQSKVVQRIFDLYVNEEQSIRAIADLLTSEGALTHSGKTNWARSSVVKILRNQTYAGCAFYNKYKRTNNGRRLVERSRDQWIPISVAAIIERPLFDEAQIRLDQNRVRLRKQPSRFYLLSGMILCTECGRPYVAQTHKGGTEKRPDDWQAYRHRSKEGHCRNRELSASRIESVVWDRIVELILKPETLLKGYESSLERQKAQESKNRILLEQLGKRRVRLERQNLNLTQAYTDPDIQLSKTEYQAQRSMILGEMSEMDQRIAEMRQDLEKTPLPPDLASFRTFSDSIAAKLCADRVLSPNEKRKLLKLLHIEVFVEPEADTLHIRGWFSAENDSLLSTTY